ncbi:MAG: hypothetical protein GTN81_14515 [Proteobacteria bacterium]|nr:hypothetical protein [Pseudomonadota bacterium]
MKPHPLGWVVEPFVNDPSYLEKSMFGCRRCYLQGRLILVLASRKQEPWQGLLILTAKEHHLSLLRQFPELTVHPVMGKWLYLPESLEDFEDLASTIVDLIVQNDPRIGVVPKSKIGKLEIREFSSSSVEE